MSPLFPSPGSAPVYGAMGAASSGTMTLASKSIKKYCTPGTVETVKSNLHYPG